MNNILVTGGAGYIGSHVSVKLIEYGYNPIVLDNFSNSDISVLDGVEKISGKKPKLYEGDILDQRIFDKIFTEQKIDGVIHFAAKKAVGESVENPMLYYSTNLSGLVNLLEAMKRHGVSNLVFSSSCTVYGQPEELPVTESSPKQEANSPYGNTKQVGEEIIEDLIKSGVDFRAISLRYFNPIGAHPSSEIGELPLGVPNNLVPFITQTAAGMRDHLTVFGGDYDTHDGTCVRDYIHVMDLADAHIRSFEYLNRIENENHYDFVNIGTGTGSTVLDAINSFEKMTGLKLNYKIGPRRPGDVEKVYANVDKSNKLLKWSTQLSLDDAMLDAWNWQKRISKI